MQHTRWACNTLEWKVAKQSPQRHLVPKRYPLSSFGIDDVLQSHTGTHTDYTQYGMGVVTLLMPVRMVFTV